MGTGDIASNAVPGGSKSFGSALVRFGFPKGSLQNATEQLFARAGVPVKVKDRNYFPTVEDDDLSLVLFRSQEISRYVADGVLDAGIRGADWIVENGSDVVEVAELKYSKATANPARWVIAVPEDSPVRDVKDLEGTLIASELVNTTAKFFENRGVRGVKVEYSWGATEVKASLPGVGAIVDITETGSSLVANKLRVVDVILESTTRLVANKDAWEDPQKRAKIENLAVLLRGAIEGKKKVGLKMNLPTHAVPALSSAEDESAHARGARAVVGVTGGEVPDGQPLAGRGVLRGGGGRGRERREGPRAARARARGDGNRHVPRQHRHPRLRGVRGFLSKTSVGAAMTSKRF